jgi:hypothetical protein
MKFSPSAQTALVVQTVNANGAIEANNPSYMLRYNGYRPPGVVRQVRRAALAADAGLHDDQPSLNSWAPGVWASAPDLHLTKGGGVGAMGLTLYKVARFSEPWEPPPLTRTSWWMKPPFPEKSARAYWLILSAA